MGVRLESDLRTEIDKMATTGDSDDLGADPVPKFEVDPATNPHSGKEKKSSAQARDSCHEDSQSAWTRSYHRGRRR
jgi:hypothetical protein